MTPRPRLSNRHHRHHRHQPMSFDDLRVTQVPLPPSPCSSPPSGLTSGDECGDGRVTQIPPVSSPRNHRKHMNFSYQKSAW
jgi:hypothetical protein